VGSCRIRGWDASFLVEKNHHPPPPPRDGGTTEVTSTPVSMFSKSSAKQPWSTQDPENTESRAVSHLPATNSRQVRLTVRTGAVPHLARLPTRPTSQSRVFAESRLQTPETMGIPRLESPEGNRQASYPEATESQDRGRVASIPWSLQDVGKGGRWRPIM